MDNKPPTSLIIKLVAIFLMAAGSAIVFFETQGDVADYSVMFYVGASLIGIGVLAVIVQGVVGKFGPQK